MKEECRIIIAGGRDFDDYELLRKVVNYITTKLLTHNVVFSPYDMVIVSGCAKGADTLCKRFADEHGHQIIKFPADWEQYGKRAGCVRNAEMAKYAVADDCYGVLVAFWDGKSKGTGHMIDTAKRYGLEVHVVEYSKED